MMIVAATILAAAMSWAVPSPAQKSAPDRLPAPSIAMRWQVPSGGKAVPLKPNQSKMAMAPVCQQIEARRADKGDDPALFEGNKDAALIAGTRKLGEEPNADAISAVLYSEGRCYKPIVVSRDVGANPKRK
jgi:hypothetical protein